MEARALTLALSAAVLAPITALAQTPSFTLVGVAPGSSSSSVRALSADGSAAAGWSSPPGGSPGFIWTAQSGRFDFGLLPGMQRSTETYAISGDGSTVVGIGTAGHAFRFSGSGPLQDLGVLSGYTRSLGFGVSGDGSVVVGRSDTGPSTGVGQAFRWTDSGGMQGLGYTQGPNGVNSEATGISRDGTTIVGNSQDFAGRIQPFVWRQGAGFTVLPQAPGTPPGESGAYGTNFDGSIVVGYSALLQTPAIWRNGQVTDLGAPAGFVHGNALAVNDDGSVVVGDLESLTSQTAGVWTEARGIEPLASYLTANGVTIPAGWTLTDCYAVSGDGLTFAGIANPPTGFGQGFVATVPEPATVLAVGLLTTLRRRRRQNS